MSKTMNVELELHDEVAIQAAATRLGVRMEGGTFQLFSSQETGTGLFFKGWNYPAVVKKDGTVAFDTYEGHWGDEKDLKEFTAYYGLEKAKIEAWQKGYSCTESYNEITHDLELEINMGG